MSENINVRPARIDDAKVIAAFNCAMALETENKTLEPTRVENGVRRMLQEPGRGFYLLAELDGTIQACLMVTYEWSDWRDADFWWIQSVYVAPEARRKGLYSALHKTIKSLAIKQKSCGVRLYVEKQNTRAQNTYQKLGMRECEYLMYEEAL
ncbi:MAG: GNAT family N-acetyltransferase [Gammaproteobacteria bacterium]|nr:GNAT family N-acetyltransferase [Gammaproteobacteria bacterium]